MTYIYHPIPRCRDWIRTQKISLGSTWPACVEGIIPTTHHVNLAA